MDKILINQMEFYGYHGVFPEEKRLGQRFIVDLIAELNLEKAGTTDELKYTVNYGKLYDLCKQVVEGKPFKLIESIAETIAKQCLSQFTQVEAVTVKVVKPDPPIPGHYESVAVEITRRRDHE